MKRIIENNIIYYQFSILNVYHPNLKHVITTRIGGYSQKPYNSLNIGIHTGDRTFDVIKNRELVCNILGYSIESMVVMKQNHTGNVSIVDLSFKGRGARRWEDGIDNTDGIITNSKGLILSSMSADCSTIIAYDPVKRVLSLAHSGWRGVLLDIIKNMLAKMEEYFHSNRKDIIVGIGPTICKRCYEVGDSIISLFKNRFSSNNDSIISYFNKGWRLDIVTALKTQLLQEGILNYNIEISNLCNLCNIKEFYSYRGENKITGRTGILAVLE